MDQLQKLQHWLLYTPLGRYVLRNERAFYNNSVRSVYGKYSLQIGLEQINLLQGNKITNHFNLNQDIQCKLQFLPLASNSVDLIVCPHILNFHNDYKHIISEFHRVLTHNGTLIITCFNDKYVFKHFCNKDIFKDLNSLFNLDELKSTLIESGFNIKGGKFFSYCPPINKSKTIRRLNWLDKAGDRWFPTLAMNFGLVMTKDTIGLTPSTHYQKDTNENLEAHLGTAKICKMK